MWSRSYASLLLALLWLSAAHADQPDHREATGSAPSPGPYPLEPPPSGEILPAPNPDELLRSVQRYIDLGYLMFQQERYDDSIHAFSAAYARKPIGQLLFNIAQAHRKAGRYAEALSLYERFLHEDREAALGPEAAAHAAEMRARLQAERAARERAAAERLAAERAARAERLASERAAQAARAQAAEERLRLERQLQLASQRRPPLHRRAWFWAVLGTALAGAAAGVALGVTLMPRDPPSDLGARVVDF